FTQIVCVDPRILSSISTVSHITMYLGEVLPLYNWIIKLKYYGAIHDCPAIKWLMSINFQFTLLLLPSNLAQQSRLSNSVGPHDSVSEPFVQDVVLGFNNCIHGVS